MTTHGAGGSGAVPSATNQGAGGSGAVPSATNQGAGGSGAVPSAVNVHGAGGSGAVPSRNALAPQVMPTPKTARPATSRTIPDALLKRIKFSPEIEFFGIGT